MRRNSGPWAVVFDLDGTLADTRRAIVPTMRASFRAAGLPVPSAERVSGTIGLSLADSAREASGQPLPAAVLDLFERHYRSAYPVAARRHARPFPETRKLPQVVKGLGGFVAVATSKSRAGCLEFLGRHWPASTFGCVVTADDVTKAKPSPEMVELITAQLNVPASRVLVVGDTTFDIAMGGGAGTMTCGVTWGNHRRRALVSAGADHVATTPRDLEAYITTLAGSLEGRACRRRPRSLVE